MLRIAPKPSAISSSILKEALRLHGKGFWIVPCEGKRANVVAEWQKRRLKRSELSDALKGTKRNIGLVLNKSALIDVECDSDEAETALQAMFDGEIPSTPTWKSKRGKHRLFRRPPDALDKAKLVIDGVEFRGLSTEKGAVSIIPPSVHSDGTKYEWLPGLSLDDVEPAELPPSIVGRLRAPEPQESSGDRDIIPIEEGKRNDTLFKLGCKLVRQKLSYDEIETTLLVRNAATCKPQLGEAEVKTIAKSASERGSQPATNAEIMLELATADVEYWHTPDGIAFATFSRDGHQEHWRVRTSTFRQWLARRFYESEARAVGSQTMTAASSRRRRLSSRANVKPKTIFGLLFKKPARESSAHSWTLLRTPCGNFPT